MEFVFFLEMMMFHGCFLYLYQTIIAMVTHFFNILMFNQNIFGNFIMPTVTKSPSFFRGLGRAQNHQAVPCFPSQKPPDFLRRLETPVAPLRGNLDLHSGRLSSDLDQRGQGHQLSWAAAKAAGHGHFLFHLLRHLVPGLPG